MATSNNSIREFVQGQYAVLLLDHVAEFKSDFIRIIFEEALLGAFLDKGKRSPLQARLSDFLLVLNGKQSVKSFEVWRSALKSRSNLDCAHEFTREKQFLLALPHLVKECVKRFNGTWISEAAKNEPLARQLAKGFLHNDDWFCRQLFPTSQHSPRGAKKTENNYRENPSLGWLFQAMLFAATPILPNASAQRNNLFLILPQLFKNEDEVIGPKEVEFERCFPVKDRAFFVQGSAFMLALADGLGIEARSCESIENCPPVFPVGEISPSSENIGVLTGLTTLFYDTAASTGTDAFSDKFAKLSFLFGNCNCIQFLPRPDKDTHGVFQIQSCVPGLIQAIWPAVVENDQRSEFPPAGQNSKLNTRFVSNADGNKVVIALPQEWRNWWQNLPDAVKQKHILNQIGSHRSPWSDKLWTGFERLQAVSLETSKYVEEVARKEAFTEAFQKSHLMLERLQAPLRELTNSLEVVQNRAQSLRTIIYEPSEGLFASYPVIRQLFDDNKSMRLFSGSLTTIQHRGNYAASPHDGLTVCAEALSRIFGSKNEKTRLKAKNLNQFRAVVLRGLEEHSESPLWTEIGLISESQNSLTAAQLLSDDQTDLRTKFIQNLKVCCFDPFKLHVKEGDKAEWPTLPIKLALHRFGFKSADAIPSEALRLEQDWTPIRYCSVLSFLIKLTSSIRSRSQAENGLITKIVPSFVESAEASTLSIYFEDTVLLRTKYPKGLDALRKIVHEHVLRLPRDWRIETTTVGNFQQPFYELASSIIGLVEDLETPLSERRWKVLSGGVEALKTSGTIHEVIKVTTNTRAFVVEIGEDWNDVGVRFSWIRNNGESSK